MSEQGNAETPPKSVRIVDGNVRIPDHKTITASGRERSRFALSLSGGISIVLLICIYGLLRFQGIDVRSMEGLIGALAGLLFGKLFDRSN